LEVEKTTKKLKIDEIAPSAKPHETTPHTSTSPTQNNQNNTAKPPLPTQPRPKLDNNIVEVEQKKYPKTSHG